MYEQVGKVDAVVCALGDGHFGDYPIKTSDGLHLCHWTTFSEVQSGNSGAGAECGLPTPFKSVLCFLA
jgi:hypothetical protein